MQARVSAAAYGKGSSMHASAFLVVCTGRSELVRACGMLRAARWASHTARAFDLKAGIYRSGDWLESSPFSYDDTSVPVYLIRWCVDGARLAAECTWGWVGLGAPWGQRTSVPGTLVRGRCSVGSRVCLGLGGVGRSLGPAYQRTSVPGTLVRGRCSVNSRVCLGLGGVGRPPGQRTSVLAYLVRWYVDAARPSAECAWGWVGLGTTWASVPAYLVGSVCVLVQSNTATRALWSAPGTARAARCDRSRLA